MRKILSSWAFVVEPPIGIEPMTYALREVRSLAPHALAAPIARAIALTAMAALELSKDPFHEPFHARGPCRPSPWSIPGFVHTWFCVTQLRQVALL